MGAGAARAGHLACTEKIRSFRIRHPPQISGNRTGYFGRIIVCKTKCCWFESSLPHKLKLEKQGEEIQKKTLIRFYPDLIENIGQLVV